MRGRGAIFSSQSMHYCTPPFVLDRVRQLGRGAIGLDPCSNARSVVGARVEWRSGGLDRDWNGYGLVFCNPPYGRAVGLWTDRCAETADRGDDVIGLVPVRSETPWWQRDVGRAVAIGFVRGRVRFLGAAGGAPFPSALVFWGSRSLALAARALCVDIALVVERAA